MKNILLIACLISIGFARAQQPQPIYNFNTFCGFFSQSDGFANNMGNWAILNNQLLFVNGTNSSQMWTTDGTNAGTAVVASTCSACVGSPQFFTVFNGKVYFSAADEINGQQLWATDGTPGGTQLFKIIGPGDIVGGNYRPGVILNGKMLFSGNDGTNGAELWSTDGTPGGTALLKDINVGNSSSAPGYFAVLGNKAYFSATDGSATGYTLWQTDGTASGTTMVKAINTTGNSNIYGIRAINGSLYFWADDGSTGTEPWISDGTSAGTKLIKDIRTGSQSSLSAIAPDFIQLNNKIYFQASDGANGSYTSLWATDGTGGGTYKVVTAPAGFTTYDATPIVAYNGKIYFSGNDALNGYELWSTDGTNTGSAMVKDINTNGDAKPDKLTAYNGKLYFRATDVSGNQRLWMTDGTATNTQMADANLNMADSSYYGTGDFVLFNGSMFFFNDVNGNLGRLYKLNIVSGIEAISANEPMSVYPNPANNQLNINGPTAQLVSIYNLEGQMLLQQQAPVNNRIDVQRLPVGLYIAEIKNGDNVYRAKWVKQ